MLTLYYGPGACSMASHIVLEESGEKYEPKRMDLAKGEQRSESYLKMNPLGRVPLLQLDNGDPLAENTAILPYLGKRFGLWPSDSLGEAKALSLIFGLELVIVLKDMWGLDDGEMEDVAVWAARSLVRASLLPEGGGRAS